MITISTKSWHYRYMSWLDLSAPHALCPYVRLLMIVLVMSLFAASMVSIFASSMLFTAAAFVNEFVYQFFDPALYAAEEGHIDSGIVVGAVLWFLAFLIGGYWLGGEVRQKLRERRWAKDGGYKVGCNKKPDSLWVQWLKAKKAKLCPLITFK